MSKNTAPLLLNVLRDDNDAVKKYKNNFVLLDAIGRCSCSALTVNLKI